MADYREGTVPLDGGLGTPALGRGRDGVFRYIDAYPESPDPVSTDETATSSAGAAVSITFLAQTDSAHVISGVAWSYDAAPTGGALSIKDGASDVVYTSDITSAGTSQVLFNPPKQGRSGRSMILTLAAPGGAVVGKVNSLGHWTRYILSGGFLDFSDENNSGLIPGLL